MNVAEQRFEDRYFKRLAAVEKQMQDIKTAQRIGLDNFVYDFSDVASSHVYLNNGEDYTMRINYIAEVPKLYASELSLSFFINNDLDPNYHWPDGAALTTDSGLRPFDCVQFYDLFNSDETGVGRKVYYLYLVNWGAFAKTIHTHVSLVFPRGNIS
jgi:hypothetical protein